MLILFQNMVLSSNSAQTKARNEQEPKVKHTSINPSWGRSQIEFRGQFLFDGVFGIE
jgi:hypothetical protein